jgi:hypothetical protein
LRGTCTLDENLRPGSGLLYSHLWDTYTISSEQEEVYKKGIGGKKKRKRKVGKKKGTNIEEGLCSCIVRVYASTADLPQLSALHLRPRQK